jgi:hypothetical protein
VAPFVPKPHTPFQWEPQDSLETTREKIDHLNRAFKRHKGLHLRWHQPEMSVLEGVFSRGDRSLAPVLEHAYRLGDVLTSWYEYFSWPLWTRCFEDCGIDFERYLQARPLEAPLPWDHICSGVSRSFLLTERKRALNEKTTRDCRFHPCRKCGVCQLEHTESELCLQAEKKNIAPVVNQASRDQDVPNIQPYDHGDEDLSFKGAQVRLWYEKTGPAAYLSQLEMQTILERALRRSQAPLSFSRGFHPKPHLSFGTALPVGVSSLEEWAIISLRRPIDEETIQALPLQKKHPQPELEAYLLSAAIANADLAENWSLFLEKPHFLWQKRTKKGLKEIDLRPFVLSAKVHNSSSIHLVFDWRQGYINPLQLILAVNPELSPETLNLCKVRQFFSLQEAEAARPLA